MPAKKVRIGQAGRHGRRGDPSRQRAGRAERGLGSGGGERRAIEDRAGQDRRSTALRPVCPKQQRSGWWGRVIGDAPTITTRASGTSIILLMFAGGGVERLCSKVGSALCRLKENQKENPKKKIATERFPFCSIGLRRKRGQRGMC